MSNYFIGNWRLILLAVTSVVLSLASGWTTWDGMSNFTRAPALSFLITFGVQGVMLISAWMLGESIVNRFRTRHPLARGFIWIAAGLMVVGVMLTFARPTEALAIFEFIRTHVLLLSTLLVAAVALATLAIWKGRAATNPVRAVLNTLMLAFMFFACMAISVFFSFDSLFAAVFPQEERQRASEIRVKSESDTILAELLDAAQKGQLALRARVLSGAAWRDYASGLDALRARLERAEAKLGVKAQALTSQLHDEKQQVLQRKIELTAIKAKAERDEQIGKKSLEDSRKAMGVLKTALTDIDKQIFDLAQQISNKETEARAEELGLGETNRAGRGPRYRALDAQVETLHLEQQRLQADKDIHANKIAKLAAEIERSEKDVLAKTIALGQLEQQIGDARVESQGSPTIANERQQQALNEKRDALATARNAYMQSVSQDALDTLERACRDGVSEIGLVVPDEQSAVSCSPKDVHVSAAPLYALTAGLQSLPAHCRASTGGNNSEPSVESFLSQARDCVQRSGLPPEFTGDIRRRIDGVERNRDDKAHRFIVTMNAFSDGNRLAYLALAIALCIDGLVFLSGLLGAATRASPFTSLPDAQGHTVAGADRIVRSALQPDPPRAASLALANCRPIPLSEFESGWTHEIALGDPGLPGASQMQRIVNAAAAIGAARRIETDRYVIRRELVEFLALHMIDSGKHEDLKAIDWRARMISAMGADVERAARAIVRKMRPTLPDGEFVTEVSLHDLAEDVRGDAVRVLNAAALSFGVKPTQAHGSDFLLRRDISEYLLRLAAAESIPTDKADSADEANAFQQEVPGDASLLPVSKDRTPPSAPSRSATTSEPKQIASATASRIKGRRVTSPSAPTQMPSESEDVASKRNEATSKGAEQSSLKVTVVGDSLVFD